MSRQLQGYTKWRHKGTGKEATFLTIAKGSGPDQGQDFAYFMAPNKSGGLVARVMRMELWLEAMEPIEEEG